MKIGSLKPKMSEVDVIGRVVEKYDPQLRGDKVYAFARLEDETGKIKLNLWGTQVDRVSVGDLVKVPKAFTHSRKGVFQLSTWADIVVLEKGSVPTKGATIAADSEESASM